MNVGTIARGARVGGARSRTSLHKAMQRRSTIAFAMMAVFAALVYGSVLQERAYRKARRPGASIFSIATMLRALFTREMLYLGLLMLGLFAFVGFIIALDEAGYLGRP